MDSLGRSVLQKNLTQLKVSPSVDPGKIACKLLIEGLVTDEDVVKALKKNTSASERWDGIMLAITESSTKDTFQKFINVLLKERELEHLGKKMKDMYIKGGGNWIAESPPATGKSQDERVTRQDSEEHKEISREHALKKNDDSEASSSQQDSLSIKFPCEEDTALQSVNGHVEKKNYLPFIPSREKKCQTFFSVLGLTEFYPQKLTLQHALEIREDTLECVKHLQVTGAAQKSSELTQCADPKQYPFFILQKIMAFDFTCRTKLVLSYEKHGDSIKVLSMGKDVKKSVGLVIHPMDGLLVVLHCADNFLRQDLMSRLATCQVAIPLLLPDPFEPEKLTFPIWAMRSIVKEWKMPCGTAEESQLVSYPSPVVSFLRIGKFSKSKSEMINTIISAAGHSFFYHYHKSGGSAKTHFVDGLVEMCWFLPSETDTFSNVVTFTNLHGDARKCKKQVQFLNQISFIKIVFIGKKNLDNDGLEVLKTLAKAPGELVLLQAQAADKDDVWQRWSSVQTVSLVDENEEFVSDDDISENIRDIINSKLEVCEQTFSSLEQHSLAAQSMGIVLDESEEHCMKGKKLAKDFLTEFKEVQETENLQKVLPLQGCDLWQQWALTEKERYRQTQRKQGNVEAYVLQKEKQMKAIRSEQLNHIHPFHPLVELFLTPLQTEKDEVKHYFLQWIQLFLGNLAREILPQIRREYKHNLSLLRDFQKRRDKDAERKCMSQIKELGKKIVGASFGFEHLLREVGQIYEAVAEQKKVPPREKHLLDLPDVAAKLMIEGYPLELMDGDAAHVPTLWVSAVLSQVQKRLGDPRLFVISVLGVQSSGKSTLLNTVFGVQFSTSAGRCTRGAFMQLLPIQHNLREEYKCDYFLIVDTEGLRAPELNALETHKHDNELATFVIGLANLTIINLSGETMAVIDDILQTAVHAFLRMKIVRLTQTCHFVHQNVTAATAGDKGVLGHLSFRNKLDALTKAAAEEEGLEDKFQNFTDVIDFDSENHVFHFKNLWKGDPPMAPINPGYCKNAQFLKLCLIAHAKRANSVQFGVYMQHLKDLWKAILHENFVFSFKNTIELVARNKLDAQYATWSWHFKKEMMTWERSAQNRMENCKHEKSLLQAEYDKCCRELKNQVDNIHLKQSQKMMSYFEESPQKEIILQWEDDMRDRLGDLKKQLHTHAEDHCTYVKSSIEAFAMVDSMKVTHRGMILEHVKELVHASQEENEAMSDMQLKEKFDLKWNEWIKDIDASFTNPMKDCDVSQEVEKCLTEFEHLRRSQQLVYSKLQEKSLHDWGTALELDFDVAHLKPSWLSYFSSPSPSLLSQGRQVTAQLLASQWRYLQHLRNKQYNPNLATELLLKLFKDIASYKSISFSKQYKVDMAFTVCGFALRVFQEIIDAEIRKNDPVEYFERKMRMPLFEIFKEEYRKTAWEVTAASTICRLLLHSLQNEVTSSLSQLIVEHMQGEYSFLHTKPALKAKILLDIGDKLDQQSDVHFKDCLLYLRNIEESIYHWLKQYTLQYCNEGRLPHIASKAIMHKIKFLKQTVESVSEEIVGKFEIKIWLTTFHSRIKGSLHLDVTELHHLGGVHEVDDVSGFKAEVITGLDKLQSQLVKYFEDMPLSEMENWTKKPQDHLFEVLAGCTEQCPFCKEQCDLTTPNHSTKHSAAMHRPECLGNYRWDTSQKMVLDICTTLVGSDFKFRNRDTKQQSHPYKKYTEVYPKWFIVTDISLDAAIFWKWLLGHHAEKIADEFKMKLALIPAEWKELEWGDVKKKLGDIYMFGLSN